MQSVTSGRGKVMAVALAAVLLVTAVPPVDAKRPPRPPSGETDYAAVAAAIDGLAAVGAPQAEIDAMLERDFGWIVVGQQTGDLGMSTLATSASNVSFSVPTVYFNTRSGRYEASATFAWKQCNTGIGGSLEPCYMNDHSGTNMGGPDAFGLRISTLVSRRGSLFTTASVDGCRHTYDVPADFEDSGVVYSEQDRFLTRCDTGNYTWHRGTIVFSFLLRSRCPKGEYLLDTKMAHTWQSTSISSVSVGASGISVTFSSSSHRWTGVSAPRSWKPCGL